MHPKAEKGGAGHSSWFGSARCQTKAKFAPHQIEMAGEGRAGEIEHVSGDEQASPDASSTPTLFQSRKMLPNSKGESLHAGRVLGVLAMIIITVGLAA